MLANDLIRGWWAHSRLRLLNRLNDRVKWHGPRGGNLLSDSEGAKQPDQRSTRHPSLPNGHFPCLAIPKMREARPGPKEKAEKGRITRKKKEGSANSAVWSRTFCLRGIR